MTSLSLRRFSHWLVRRLKTIQTQILLIAIATLLVIGGVVVVLGVWVTNRLKQHLVSEAQVLAHEEVEKFSRQLIELAKREGGGTLAAAVHKHPEVENQLRILVRKGGTIDEITIQNPEGTVLMRRKTGQEFTEKLLGPRESISSPLGDDGAILQIERIQNPKPLPLLSSPPSVVQEKIPITEGNQVLGYLSWGLTDVSGSEQIHHLSSAITQSLSWMAGLLLFILAVTIGLLYRVFVRHLRLQREKEAQAKMATIGTLAAGLAHEIRNPLQIINMNLEVIREDYEAASDGAGLHGAVSDQSAPSGSSNLAVAPVAIIGRVQDQVRQLNSILTHFLQYAIPGRLEMEGLSLRPLIGGVLDFAAPELEKRGVHPEMQIPEEARIRGDSSALRQVFLNIILNACQAMEKSPEKRLRILAQSDRPGGWQLRFEDTGCGVPDGKEEEIFEAFVSLRPGGTGFGLAIARRIVEEHGGRIWAESHNNKSGAVFRIQLPADSH